MDLQGNVIIDLAPQMIKFMFNAPAPKNPRKLNEAKALKLYSDKKETNRNHMNKTWIRIEKKSLAKVPNQSKRADFYKEIAHIIMMLSRVFRKRDSS